MNKLRLLPYLFAVFITVGFSSCGDDDDDATPSEVVLLTSDTWNGQSIYYTNMDVTDEFTELVGIDIRDTDITFNADGTYSESYGTDSYDGDWEYTSDRKTIIFDKGTDEEFRAKVSKLDEDTLYLIYAFDTESGTTEEFEFRYIH